MSLAERYADLWNGFLGRIRHRDAKKLTAGNRHDFDEFSGHRHCLVVTYRGSGEPVPTPVWFGVADDRIYFRSEERVGKIKRIRGNDRVLVSPCDSRGKPRGEGVEARARILPPDQEEHAEQAIQSNFGGGRRMYESVAMRFGPEGVYVEVTAV